MSKYILVTGGLGFIGSHTIVEILKNPNLNVIIIDNLSNSSIDVLEKIINITHKLPIFYQIDIRDQSRIEWVFLNHPIHSVIHFASLKCVSESLEIPLDYYENNLSGTIHLLDAMKKFNVKNLIFSSSASVYGPQREKIKEHFFIKSLSNPYARIKYFIEQILQDLHHSDPSWNIRILRYFNPVGSHPSGLLPENPKGKPNNLFPCILQSIQNNSTLCVFGNDYPTIDGTCIRDYIHVVDLAKGHIAALEHLDKSSGLLILNLGTGNGSTVLQVVRSMQKFVKENIRFKIQDRRPGDVAYSVADPSLAFQILGWKAELTLDEMCRDSVVRTEDKV
jgi:UDP-glucose 4-epimerase